MIEHLPPGIVANAHQIEALDQLEKGLRRCGRINRRMYGGVARWVALGIAPGDFLCAVLNNDLHEAAGRADEDNQAALFDWAALLYNWLPSQSHGSPAKFAAWAARHGLADAAQIAQLWPDEAAAPTAPVDAS